MTLAVHDDRGRGGDGGKRRLQAVSTEPPNDPGAETAVLGAMLLSREAALAGVEILAPGDFYRPSHGYIFEAIANLALNDQAADPVTVTAELKRLGRLDEIGDGSVLISLQVSTPTSRNVEQYAELVLGCSRARRKLYVLREIAAAVQAGDEESAQRWQAELDGVLQGRSGLLEAVDVAALMRDPEPPVEPELLLRTDKRAVLVRGSVTLLHGEPSAGKSWLTLEAVRQAVAAGENVVMLDYEGNGRSLAARLVELGASADDVDAHLVYIQPGDCRPEILCRLLLGAQPDLVVIDSMAEAVATLGLEENDNAGHLRYISALARPLAAAGAAVVIIDHVAKSKEDRGRWGRGAGAKLFGVDAAFSLELVEPFARGHAGSSALRIAKDRYGAVGPEKSIAAMVHYGGDMSGRLGIRLEPPAEDTPWVGPIDCMAAIVDVLRARDGEELSGRQLGTALRAIGKGFKDSVVREAAERLALDSSKPVVRHVGAKGAHLYGFSPSVVNIDPLDDF